MIDLGKFDHDRSLFSRTLESWWMLGKSSPFMAARFRLVNYDNLSFLYNLRPPFDSVQLVQITPISLWFMVLIPIVTGAYKPTYNYKLCFIDVYGIYNELVTGANLNQQTSLGASHCTYWSPRHDWKEAAKDQAVHQHDAQPTAWLALRWFPSPVQKKIGEVTSKETWVIFHGIKTAEFVTTTWWTRVHGKYKYV